MTGGRRAAVVAVATFGALGLPACASSSSSAPSTTATGATVTTAGSASSTTASGAVPNGLCALISAFSRQELGLGAAAETAGGSSGDLAALTTYARQSKAAFDQAAPEITAGLSTAPAIVRSSWATLVPLVDRLFAAATTAASVGGFTSTADSIESTNAFTSADQTVSAFTKGACPSSTSS
ncbi:MAG: hypothetical protein ABSF84_02085 [Acidimicrobiales bacterium]